MFDNKPKTTTTRAVGAVRIESENNGQRKQFHYIEDIYDPDTMPPDDINKYVVPQENELVFDVLAGIIYRVAHVDTQATLKSTLVPWDLNNTDDDGGTDEQDWIFGLRGGPQNGEALLAIDYSVRPNVARVDATIMRPGAAYALLFEGNDCSSNGKIISAQYDKSSNMVTNQVPVKLAEIVDRTNMSIMTTGTFSVTENEEALIDGSRCTLVFYDEGGNWIPPAQPVMVQHSTYMKDHQIGIKYVTNIELLGPWFTNTTDPERMLIPINTNILSIEFRAAVYYSDGSVVKSAVNGDKFSFYGLQEHRPTYPGQTSQVTLVYKLSDDEQFYKALPGDPDHMSRVYTLEASEVTGTYSPKIYTYPEWDTTNSQYSLRHYLYDLDRDIRIDVTDKVTFNDQSPAFKPKTYGVEQSLIFNLNMRDVNPTYESVIFIQHTTIVLYKDINYAGKKWDVKFAYDMPAYVNKEIQVVNAGTNTTFNLGNGYATQEEWLNAMYWAIDPSYNIWSEEVAPTPNAFDLMDSTGRKFRFGIQAWNIDNPINIQLQRGATWYICWVNSGGLGIEQELAVTGVTVNDGTYTQ